MYQIFLNSWRGRRISDSRKRHNHSIMFGDQLARQFLTHSSCVSQRLNDPLATSIDITTTLRSIDCIFGPCPHLSVQLDEGSRLLPSIQHICVSSILLLDSACSTLISKVISNFKYVALSVISISRALLYVTL